MKEIVRFACNVLPLFGQPWFLTADPLSSVCVLRRTYRTNCGRSVESLHCHEKAKIVNVYWCFCTSPLAVASVVGFVDLHRVSISSELESPSLSMCIEAPQSTTNSLSSGNIEIGAGIAFI